MKPTLTGVVALLFPLAAMAASPEEIKVKINKQYPESHVQMVTPSPQIPGWLEVQTDSELIYANADGSVLFVGRLIDAETKEDLTGKRLNTLRAIDFNTLPLDLAIKTVHGKGTRKLAVFSDPHCPYCQGLEPELAKLDDVTIYTFLYPLESIHPGATETAGRIWCAPDRAAAWSEWMLKKTQPPAAANCDRIALDTLQGFGTRTKIDTTPTLFLANGSRIGGFMAAADLEKALAEVQHVPVAKR